MHRVFISFALCLPELLAADVTQGVDECSARGQCVSENGRLVAAEIAAFDGDEQAIEFLQSSTRLSLSQSRKHEPEESEEKSGEAGEAEESGEPETLGEAETPAEPTSGAEASGVSKNGEGDLEAFIAALISNIVMIVGCIAFFGMAMRIYPTIYKNNTICGVQPYPVPEGYIGWARAALGISVQQIQDSVGLDQAMLLEFAQMNMKICAAMGAPMFFIMGTMNMHFGGHAAGKDYLSYFSMGNVEQGSSLYWIHSYVVWGVVMIVQGQIYSTMETYGQRRIDWLQKLPLNRATTIMIENIPEEHQTDARLKKFFQMLFGDDKVKKAYLAKRAPKLKAEMERKEEALLALETTRFKWAKTGDNPLQRPKSFRGIDLLEFYEKEIIEAKEGIKIEREEAQKLLTQPGGVNGCNGFVTFADPSTAEIALSMQYGSDAEKWVTSLPPPASSIIWQDLEQDPKGRAIWTVVGYILTAALYCLYLPSVIWITTIAFKIKFPDAIQPLWEGLAPTLGLLFMVSFLPTFLVIIFRTFFTLNDDSYTQYTLQNWYFIFQFVFVILVTAIGDSLFEFMKTLVMTPLEIMPMLAKTMPLATHFYMNFIVLAWAAHATSFTRSVPLMKYIFFKQIFEEEQARSLSEPEDQDYYGLGSRHARFAIMMCIGIIFGTLSPPIPLLTFVNFFLCRLVYGYLIPFAEQKKPDLGGIFFVRACRHLFIGNITYVLLMTGVLYARAKTGGPATISILSLPYVIIGMRRFDTEFMFNKLPFEEHIKKGADDKHRGTDVAPYIQPEWM